MSSHALGLAVFIVATLLLAGLIWFGWSNRRPRSTRKSRYDR
jgi:hypothetical protein